MKAVRHNLYKAVIFIPFSFFAFSFSPLSLYAAPSTQPKQDQSQAKFAEVGGRDVEDLERKKKAAQEAAPAFENYFKALNSELLEREYLLDLAQQALIAEEGILIMGPPGNAKSLLADRVLGGIKGQADGKPSYYRIQMTPETTLSETHGPISYKALQEEDKQVRKYEEGMLKSRNVFIDEIFDARANATRNILGMLAERSHAQGSRIEPGEIETFIAATNKYLSEVYESAGNDGPKALLDRFSFTSFVPKDFESVASDLAILRVAKGKSKQTQQKGEQAQLYFEDLEKIRGLVPEVELPDHVLLFLSVLVDRYGREIENFETASLKTYQDKMRDGEIEAPPYRATKYMSIRTMGKAAGILRALVVKRWLKSDPSQKPDLIANLEDVRNLENFYTLNGPNEEFVSTLLGRTTNPHERAQLEAIQRERRSFRGIYGELKKNVDQEIQSILSGLHKGFHKAMYGSGEEKTAFAKELAQKAAILSDRPDLSALSKTAITDKTIPHLMLMEALESTAAELVAPDEWSLLLKQAMLEASKSAEKVEVEVEVEVAPTTLEAKMERAKTKCPEGYIPVPTNASYAKDAFCVMKYAASKGKYGEAESKQGAMPWVMIDRKSAGKACEQNGADYHLLTNNEWMTIARDIEANDKNWSGGSVGNGTLSRGNSESRTRLPSGPDEDPHFNTKQSDWIHRRTHILSNSEVIWDMAGNVWQWVSDSHWVFGSGLKEYSELPSAQRSKFGPAGKYNSKQGMGKISLGKKRAVLRGGGWHNANVAGVFAVVLDFSAGGAYDTTGFRCALSASSAR